MWTARCVLLGSCFCSFLLGSHGWVAPKKNGQRSALLSREESSSSSSSKTNSNVVLTPGNDPNAFDSFKIGSPRVHRYARETASDCTTEYVMWYHGRSQTMHNTNRGQRLPPLSTGRIGRATSRNGLVWEKDKTGSVSEDAPDVSLGLNQESWWGFDVSHVGLGNVLLPMSTPAIMTEGGVYLMFYHGGNFEETPVADYMEDTMQEKLPRHLLQATMQGMKMRIGVAVSQDGITWGRVEGDDPTGACVVPYDRSDPNSLENAPDHLEEELYCAWPEVAVVTKGEPSSSSPFIMYYSTMLKGSKKKCIGYAMSQDGFRWEKKGICLRPEDDDGLDVAGVARCCVVKDALFDEDRQTWEELTAWKMYFEGVAKDGKHRIMVAESRDGIVWRKCGLALDVGAEGAFDCAGAGTPNVVR
jgi:hypothetical protein